MKTSLTGLLRGRITRRSLLAAALPAAGASVAWAKDEPENQPTIRLEGTWIAFFGSVMTFQLLPLDPAGKTAVTRATSITYGSWQLLAAYGADSVSDFVGQAVMTGHNTAEILAQSYGVKSGNPPAIKLIWVVSGTLEFQDPETMLWGLSLAVYLPGPNGFPQGNPLFPPATGQKITVKRMPLPCPVG